MASIQRSGFSSEQNQFSNIFRALGHPARIMLIELLIQEKRINCKLLALEVPLSATTVNRHIRVLYECGILGYEKYLNQTFYVLNPLVFEHAGQYLSTKYQNNERNHIDYRKVHFHIDPKLN